MSRQAPLGKTKIDINIPNDLHTVLVQKSQTLGIDKTALIIIALEKMLKAELASHRNVRSDWLD